MQLSRALIKNYRSIRDLKVTFDPKCRVLVGINESGKSNILSALNLLDRKQSPTRRDVREPGLHEGQITEAYVRFVFSFTNEETLDMYENLKPKLLSRTHDSALIRMDTTNYTPEELCRSREGLYWVDVLTGTRYTTTWGFGKSQIINGWKKAAPACPPDFSVSLSESSKAVVKNFALVDASQFPEIPAEYLQDADPDDLWAVVRSVVAPKVDAGLPRVLFWNYDDSKLLPPRVDLDQFCSNPDICLPLKRMFQLYRIPDIKKEVTAARGGSANALPNLLRRVAEETSKHFHSTWREYEGIKFSLSIDGPSLVPAIEDESNHYELSQRSDGFKRFVTFLLMVSAEEASGSLKNTLLLIDEPENGLHPTGARYLMEELIDISKNNFVVFSTHSIFMIDNKIIKRHLITKKKNEITEAVEVSESNIQDEEVIYKSLGYSIFSNLKEKNLIFEGWKDKKLFETAISRVPAAYATTKELKNIGHCFARGVKQIESITPLFEAGNRKCLILSDSDRTAKEHQRRYEQGKGYGVWKRYDEILEGTHAITGEDFIKEEAFEAAIDEMARAHNIAALPTPELSENGKVNTLRQWLLRAGVAPEDAERSVEEIKEAVFDAVRNADIKAEYYDYLAGILPIVEAL